MDTKLTKFKEKNYKKPLWVKVLIGVLVAIVLSNIYYFMYMDQNKNDFWKSNTFTEKLINAENEAVKNIKEDETKENLEKDLEDKKTYEDSINERLKKDTALLDDEFQSIVKKCDEKEEEFIKRSGFTKEQLESSEGYDNTNNTVLAKRNGFSSLKEENRLEIERKRDEIENKKIQLKRSANDSINELNGNYNYSEDKSDIKYIAYNKNTGKIQSNTNGYGGYFQGKFVNEENLSKLKENSDFFILLDYDNQGEFLKDYNKQKNGEQGENTLKDYRNSDKKDMMFIYSVPKDGMESEKRQYQMNSIFVKVNVFIYVAVVIVFFLIALVSDYNEDKELFITRLYQKLYIEIKVTAIVLAIRLLLIVTGNYIGGYSFIGYNFAIWIGWLFIIYGLVYVNARYIHYIYKVGIKKGILENSLTYIICRGIYRWLRKNKNNIVHKLKKIINDYRYILSQKDIKDQVNIVIVASIIFGILMILALISRRSNPLISFLITLAMIALAIAVPIWAKNYLIQLQTIIDASYKISKGNFNCNLECDGNILLNKVCENLNDIKNGFERSVEEEIKSQKMKTELITNVSHDLKTPLTSIISYVGLLKDESLSEEKRKEYINVLDRKSLRLKALIEDLFEAAKLSSGNMELNREKLNIVALLRQTLGEFEEKIDKSNLDFKVDLPKDPIYVFLDGARSWRIFENLIVNSLKYSLENSRVYINVFDEDDDVKIVMKNISAVELNISPDELIERFKRGDESRNTEGSGLGLSIVNSLVSIQGGRFDLDIDGDLFKVTITFKKYKEEL